MNPSPAQQAAEAIINTELSSLRSVALEQLASIINRFIPEPDAALAARLAEAERLLEKAKSALESSIGWA